MNPGLTRELKFVGSEHLFPAALAMLEALCPPDPRHAWGRIQSIYFDTPRQTALAEKWDGDNLKRKIRIRWYDDAASRNSTEPATLFIEAKYRVGSARHKRRKVTTASRQWIDTVALDDPALTGFMYRHMPELGDAIPLDLVPAICVSYVRHRRICPLTGTRIALDGEIGARRFNPAHYPATTGVRLDQIVCEFKDGVAAAPEWSGGLYATGFRLRSFSKFSECMHGLQRGGVTS